MLGHRGKLVLSGPCVVYGYPIPKSPSWGPGGLKNVLSLCQSFSTGVLLPPSNIWWCLETFLVVITGEGAGMPLNIPPCTRQAPMTQNYLVQNINSAKLEKSCMWSNSFPLSFLTLLHSVFTKWLRTSAQTTLGVGDLSLSKKPVPSVSPSNWWRYSLHWALSALPPFGSAF